MFIEIILLLDSFISLYLFKLDILSTCLSLLIHLRLIYDSYTPLIVHCYCLKNGEQKERNKNGWLKEGKKELDIGQI